MDHFNNSDDPIYKKGLTRTENIEDILKKTRVSILNNNCTIGGPKEDILKHLKGGPAKNLINNFFRYKTDKCDRCGIQKSKTIQLDRAHCNKDGCDRSSLLEKAIDEYFTDETTPILIKDILRTFIKYHKEIPLYILCKECHREYDR